MGLKNSLYLYGIIKAEEPNWADAGTGKKQIFIISEGKLGALAHLCDGGPYAPKNLAEVKELILAHNNVLEKAARAFGGVLPCSFNTVIQEKEGKTSEENLRNWLKAEAGKIELLWERVKGAGEYGIRIFYDRKKMAGKTEPQNEKNQGINYLLEKKREYQAKNILIGKIKDKKSETFDKIKAKVKEAKIVQSAEFIKEEKDILLNISVLANGEQIGEVRQYLQESAGEDGYRLVGPFPPYSFALEE